MINQGNLDKKIDRRVNAEKRNKMLHSEEERQEQITKDKEKIEKVKKDFANVVVQHDALIEKIVAELHQAESDLDSLLSVKNEIAKQPKETLLIINGLLANDIQHLVPTIKAKIVDARRLLENK